MANFFSILKKIGSAALGVEKVAAPIAEAVFPQFAPAVSMLDGWVNRVQGAVVSVEANPVMTDGTVKSNAVIADFETGLDLTNSVLAMRGKQLSYDKAALQDAINSFVAGYNALAKVKASFQEVDIPKS